MEQKNDVKIKVKMISAVNEALKFKKANPSADNEKILKHITKLTSKEKHKQLKLAMIAAVSEALKLTEKQDLLDREVIKKIMPELEKILGKIDN